MITIDDITAMRMYGMKVGQQVEGALIAPMFNNYVFKITGGDDKSGVAMKCGVMTDKRVRLLLSKGQKGYRGTEKGVRKRKSVRGAIISSEIVVVSLAILKEGETPIPGVTDSSRACSHLPKRASKLRRLFNIPEGVDIAKFIREKCMDKLEGKKRLKIRVTRLPTEEKAEKVRKVAELKKIKKERSINLRKEYMKKYFNEIV